MSIIYSRVSLSFVAVGSLDFLFGWFFSPSQKTVTWYQQGLIKDSKSE